MKFKGFILNCVPLLTLLQSNCLHEAKILGFFATVSRSHFILQEPVMRELAKRGHEVTVVTSFKQSGEPLENYRYVEIPDLVNDPAIAEYLSNTVQSSGDLVASFSKGYAVFNKMLRFSKNFLNHPEFLPLKRETFDLIVIGWFVNEYALGLSGHFHCPSVIISPYASIYPIRRFSGNPSSVSTVPSLVLQKSSKMSFFDRVFNVFAHVVEFVVFELIFIFYMKPLYFEEFPPDKYPSFEEVLHNVSLVMVAQHFSGQISEPLLPGVIEVEGMHVKKESNPLPGDIKEFLDNATDGAIFFSLGSNAKSSDLSKQMIKMFLKKFQKIRQNVLWKFETDLPNLPRNVKIGKWLPQDDILAHPNVKLFISHCGKGGITEAKYHGVPILAIPLFADQFGNAESIVREGWAVKLSLSDISVNRFSNALDEALNNSTYTRVAKKLSNLNQDRPEHPLDKAAFWIEYVIRHNGAKHLQSPAIH